MKLRILSCCIFLLSVSSSIFAQGDILAEVKNLYPHDVKVDGFVLDADQDVSIKGLLAGNRRDDVYTSAWILNARTRTVAWKSRGMATADCIRTFTSPSAGAGGTSAAKGSMRTSSNCAKRR